MVRGVCTCGMLLFPFLFCYFVVVDFLFLFAFFLFSFCVSCAWSCPRHPHLTFVLSLPPLALAPSRPHVCLALTNLDLTLVSFSPPSTSGWFRPRHPRPQVGLALATLALTLVSRWSCPHYPRAPYYIGLVLAPSRPSPPLPSRWSGPRQPRPHVGLVLAPSLAPSLALRLVLPSPPTLSLRLVSRSPPSPSRWSRPCHPRPHFGLALGQIGLSPPRPQIGLALATLVLRLVSPSPPSSPSRWSHSAPFTLIHVGLVLSPPHPHPHVGCPLTRPPKSSV